jgi:hypothetical protein
MELRVNELRRIYLVLCAFEKTADIYKREMEELCKEAKTGTQLSIYAQEPRMFADTRDLLYLLRSQFRSYTARWDEERAREC